MSWKNNKKAQVFARLGELAVGVVTLALVLTIGFLIMAQGKTEIASIECANTSDTSGLATCGYGYNGTSALESAVATIPGWIPLIIISVIGLVLLGFVGLYRKVTG